MNGGQQMQTDTTIVPADIEWLDSFPGPILVQVYIYIRVGHTNLFFLVLLRIIQPNVFWTKS